MEEKEIAISCGNCSTMYTQEDTNFIEAYEMIEGEQGCPECFMEFQRSLS